MDTPSIETDVKSCKETFGKRCKVIENQGDYAWIIRLQFSNKVSAQFAIPKGQSKVIEAYLVGQNLPETLQNSFSRAISPYKSPLDLGSCMENADKWWATVGNGASPSSKQPIQPSISAKGLGKGKTSKNLAEEDKEGSAAGSHGMKPAQDVISRILWDENLPAENFLVGYVDRFLGILEKPFRAFNWDHFSTVDPESSAIPRHRIQYFKYGHTILWDRRNRLDLIFGSGIQESAENCKSLKEIIQEENEKLGSSSVFEEDEEEKDFGGMDEADFEGFEDVPQGIIPNFYLSIPIRSPELLNKVSEVQESFLNHFPQAIKKCMKPETLHVTLCLFSLEQSDDDEAIKSLAQLIIASEDELKEILLETKMALQGLAVFRKSRVIYTKLDKKSMRPLMQKLACIFLENHVEFFVPEIFHLTVAKLRQARDERFWHPVEDFCSVSRFSGVELRPILSLKTSSRAVDDGNVKEYLGDFGVTTKIVELQMEKRPEEEGERKILGFHVRNAFELGSLEEAVYNVSAVGGSAMAFFFHSPREWDGKTVKIPKNPTKFHEACQKAGVKLENIVPHGTYLLNPGSTDPKHLQKSRERMTKDIENCEKLGIKFYNFHPGILTAERSVENFIENVGETINYVHEQTKDSSVILLIETAAGQGCEVGGKFEELKAMLDLVEDKERIGVCMDTCHIFAAGYDIGSPMGYERTMVEFDRIIGLKNLKAIHLNDSKGTFGCKQDRHQIIGQGYIGLNAFRFIMNDSRLNGIPMILETPKQEDGHLSEIQLLKSFEGSQSGASGTPIDGFHNLTINEFSDEILQFHLKNAQDDNTFQAKEAIREKLEFELQKEFGEDSHLIGIGSFINGLGKKDSDLDLSLLIPKSATTISQSSSWQSSIDNLRRAQAAIGSNTELRTGVVPVLRFRKPELNNILIDMSCNYLECIYNSRLLQCYSKLDSRFGPLCLVIKEWAASEGINNAKEGFMNNYTFLLLTLHYLQAGCEPPVLPNLQALYPGMFPKTDDDDPLTCIKQFSELEMVLERSSNDSPMGELLTGFFSYYSTFPFEEKWISIKSGSVRKRSELDSDKTKFLVYVEDPFEEKNTARALFEKEKMQKIRNAFQKAFCKCHRGLGIRHLVLVL